MRSPGLQFHQLRPILFRHEVLLKLRVAALNDGDFPKQAPPKPLPVFLGRRRGGRRRNAQTGPTPQGRSPSKLPLAMMAPGQDAGPYCSQ